MARHDTILGRTAGPPRPVQLLSVQDPSRNAAHPKIRVGNPKPVPAD
jgi:hypothetical protein